MATYAVTGSASGIGAATRERLEKRGHRVVGVDLREAEVVADLATPEGRATAVEAVRDACGGTLDGLVTAAGVGPPFDPQQIVSINYFGSHAFLDGLRPELAASGDAQVVAVSSNSTTTTPGIPAPLVQACLDGDEALARSSAAGTDDGVAYAASKTAIAHYVRQRAPTAEWAGRGIRLNAIAPGATLTPMLQAGLDDDDIGPLIRGFPVPTGGFGSADQIAAWIEQMLIGDGASFLCGSVLFVDGGTDAMVRPTDWPAALSI